MGGKLSAILRIRDSSYSLEENAASVNKNCRDNNFSGNGTKWEDNTYRDTPITEISEVCSLPVKQLKKVLSIVRLRRSCPIVSVEGTNGTLSNEKKFNGGTMSPN